MKFLFFPLLWFISAGVILQEFEFTNSVTLICVQRRYENLWEK